MSVVHYRHPWRFYALATAVPWCLWLIAAWLSRRAGETNLLLETIFGLAGLCAPTIIAWRMMRADPVLRADAAARLTRVPTGCGRYLILAVVLMPASILLAQALSLGFGYSAAQFRFSGGTSFSGGILPGWFFLLAAPIIEELAWHSYGTDALWSRMRLFTASMLFAFYWAVWHMPLALIEGYYHATVVEAGALHSLNFIVSLFPFVLLMNWLYVRTGRNILVAALFHLTAGVANEMFQTHPDSKVIQTGLLLLLCGPVLWRERKLFFSPSSLPRRGR